MTTPNLDATQHCWVESLLRFTFSIEYQKGRTMQPWMLWAKSPWTWMQEPWSPSWMESLWEWQKEWMLMIQQWLRLIKKNISKSGKLLFWLEPAGCMWTYMWLIGWPPNRRIKYLRLWSSGFVIRKCRIWNSCWEMTQILRREKLSFWQQKRQMLYQGALYHCHMPTGELEEVLQCVVPMAHWVAAMNEWHQDAGHQGQWQTLYLLHDKFW